MNARPIIHFVNPSLYLSPPSPHQIHMDGKPYKCNECDDASFALLGEFRAHIAEAHADTKDVRCSECYKVFGGAEELRSHVRLEHRLECEVCMRTFSRLAYLQAHIEVRGPGAGLLAGTHRGEGARGLAYLQAHIEVRGRGVAYLQAHIEVRGPGGWPTCRHK